MYEVFLEALEVRLKRFMTIQEWEDAIDVEVMQKGELQYNHRDLQKRVGKLPGIEDEDEIEQLLLYGLQL